MLAVVIYCFCRSCKMWRTSSNDIYL